MSNTLSSDVQLRLGEKTPCPYIPGRIERHAFAVFDRMHLKTGSEYMNRAGFRRSMNTAYMPVCPGCRACQSVRVRVDEFQDSRSFRRIRRKNADLRFYAGNSEYTDAHYALFHRYVQARHPKSDMNMIDADYYARLVGIVPEGAFLLCAYDGEDRLLAVTMVDDFDDGMSAVYSFFEPEQPKRSLGLMLILELLRYAREVRKPYVYLGYYIAGVSNMAYKTRFSPLEYYDWNDGLWQEFTGD